MDGIPKDERNVRTFEAVTELMVREAEVNCPDAGNPVSEAIAAELSEMVTEMVREAVRYSPLAIAEAATDGLVCACAEACTEEIWSELYTTVKHVVDVFAKEQLRVTGSNSKLEVQICAQ